MNTISVSKDEIKQRIAKLKEDIAKSKNKAYKKVLKGQVRYWEDRLDWFYQNESYRNPGNDYKGIEDYRKIREDEGYTAYHKGYTKVGDVFFTNKRR